MIKIKCKLANTIVIGVYAQPNKKDIVITKLKWLVKIASQEAAQVIVAGDLNMNQEEAKALS